MGVDPLGAAAGEQLQDGQPRTQDRSGHHTPRAPKSRRAQGWSQEPPMPHPREYRGAPSPTAALWEVLTLEIVTFAIHEDVVHEHHAEHAGVDMEVAEDQREVGWLRGRGFGVYGQPGQPRTDSAWGRVCHPLNPLCHTSPGWGLHQETSDPTCPALSREETLARAAVSFPCPMDTMGQSPRAGLGLLT